MCVQCIDPMQWCNGREECVNGVDEQQCPQSQSWESGFVPPPAILNVTLNNTFSFTPISPHSPCPETHFQCPYNGYCLPVFMRCNDVNDCPGHEDEQDCRHHRCPGMYRCRSSDMCVHPLHLCDHVYQCPLRDDEIACDVQCPPQCTCLGWAFFCKAPFNVSRHTQLRYLHARGSALKLPNVAHNTMLVHLALSDCGLSSLQDVRLPNLHSLDVSDNQLHRLRPELLAQWERLKMLSLAGNPLMHDLFADRPPPSYGHPSMLSLDLSRQDMRHFNMDVFQYFPNLRSLNLSDCNIHQISPRTLPVLGHLQSVDFRGSPIHSMPQNLFEGLQSLRSVYADNYKLCCADVLPPGFYSDNCLAPFNEVSSCESLLRSNVHRAFLSLFSILALLGNLGSFFLRAFVEKTSHKSSFAVFVIHLCMADFLMGVYLAVIGVADRLYFGSYLWEDTSWRRSTACHVAGMLCLLSSEVSAILICLITLDRLLVLRFPFSRLHFSHVSSQCACYVAWLGGLALAFYPFLPAASHWDFYSQTATCFPLPVTSANFPGHVYSFGIMIVFNFVLFLLIAAGQTIIYWTVSGASTVSSTADSGRKSRDMAVARRLVTIVVTDFLCWFPVGALGLLATGGTPVAGEVNVALGICVLPINSAVNPFLYTLNTLLQARRARQEAAMLTQLAALKAKTAGIQ